MQLNNLSFAECVLNLAANSVLLGIAVWAILWLLKKEAVQTLNRVLFLFLLFFLLIPCSLILLLSFDLAPYSKKIEKRLLNTTRIPQIEITPLQDTLEQDTLLSEDQDILLSERQHVKASSTPEQIFFSLKEYLRPIPLINLWGVIWILGAVIAILRIINRGVWIVHYKKTLQPLDEKRAQRFLQIMSENKEALSKIYLTNEKTSPFCIGFSDPKIVFSKESIDLSSNRELIMMLHHECVHLQQRDTFLGLLQAIIKGLHWWNPFIHLLNHRLTLVREQLCDLEVMKHLNDPLSYSKILIKMTENFSPSKTTMGMAPITKNFQDLKKRIHLITEKKKENTMKKPSICTVTILILILGASSLGLSMDLQSQPESHPQGKSATIELTKDEETETALEKKKNPLKNTPQTVLIQSKLFLGKDKTLTRALSIVTQVGEKTIIQVAKELLYPDEYEPKLSEKGMIVPKKFESANLGLTLEITPYLKEGKIQLVGKIAYTHLDDGLTKPNETELDIRAELEREKRIDRRRKRGFSLNTYETFFENIVKDRGKIILKNEAAKKFYGGFECEIHANLIDKNGKLIPKKTRIDDKEKEHYAIEVMRLDFDLERFVHFQPSSPDPQKTFSDDTSSNMPINNKKPISPLLGLSGVFTDADLKAL